MADDKDGKAGDFLVASNRKAHYEYFVDHTLEAGLSLTGTEVKSLRGKNAQLADGYAMVENGQVILHHVHIAPYAMGNCANHEPMRPRKLLLHRREITRLWGLTRQQGYTLIPLRLYFTRGKAKVALGVCRGKKAHDKRHVIAERESKREVSRAIRSRGRDI
ncbi:MAG: SsrA-binding protein SmpB [Candidatus Eisenbacteria bacterium]